MHDRGRLLVMRVRVHPRRVPSRQIQTIAIAALRVDEKFVPQRLMRRPGMRQRDLVPSRRQGVPIATQRPFLHHRSPFEVFFVVQHQKFELMRAAFPTRLRRGQLQFQRPADFGYAKFREHFLRHLAVEHHRALRELGGDRDDAAD